MEATDLRKFPILYVDDERQNLVTFRYALGDSFEVLTAESGEEGRRMLEERDVAVLIADQRMPGMTGVELCSVAREIRPDTVRIILTAYADLQAAIDAINRGHVLKYLTKPWRDTELREVLNSSIELVRLQRTVRDMQARMFQRGTPQLVDAIGEEIVRVLHDPVAALDISAVQVRDLLDTGIASWGDQTRARALVEGARDAHADVRDPIETLKDALDRMRRRQRPDPQAQEETCDAAAVVRAAARMLEGVVGTAARLRIVLEDAPVVPMEPGALGQVITHLVVNAAEAIEGAGRAPGNIGVMLTRREGRAVLAVVDDGPGIERERLERVFDPFVTSKEGQAQGLGLAVVQRLVAAAGGEVRAESTPGKGSQFILSLPRLATAG